jgi:hypothetical protein
MLIHTAEEIRNCILEKEDILFTQKMCALLITVFEYETVKEETMSFLAMNIFSSIMDEYFIANKEIVYSENAILFYQKIISRLKLFRLNNENKEKNKILKSCSAKIKKGEALKYQPEQIFTYIKPIRRFALTKNEIIELASSFFIKNYQSVFAKTFIIIAMSVIKDYPEKYKIEVEETSLPVLFFKEINNQIILSADKFLVTKNKRSKK